MHAADGFSKPTITQRHAALTSLTLGPLRLLLPSTSFHVPLELHNTRHSPYAKQNSLGGLTLLPWYSLAQTKCAILRHCSETAHVLVRGSVEVDLKSCLATPYIHVLDTNRKQAQRAYSFAYVCDNKRLAPRHHWAYRLEEGSLIAKSDGASVWIALSESSIFLIMREITQGNGKIVVRVFYSWPGRERRSKEKRRAMLKEEEMARSRVCEATTAAGSPVVGLGVSPGVLAGSPESAGSGGSGSDGCVDGLFLGEPAVCEPCEMVRV